MEFIILGILTVNFRTDMQKNKGDLIFRDFNLIDFRKTQSDKNSDIINDRTILFYFFR